MRNAAANPRPALALAIMATVALGGCIEKRTVYRDDDDRRPRYSWRSDGDDDWFRARPGVVCNEDDRVCYRDGRAHRGATRRVFGRSAVRDRW